MKNFFAIYILLTTISLYADSISIKGGSILNGLITQIEYSQIKIKTNFAALITIKRTKILSYSLSINRYYKLKDGRTLFGKMAFNNKKIKIISNNKTYHIKENALLSSWGKNNKKLLYYPVQKKEIKKPSTHHWKYDMATSLNAKTGNTTRLGTRISTKAILKTENTTFKWYARSYKTKENGVSTEDEIIGGFDFESVLHNKRCSYYNRYELESDKIEKLDLRATMGLGVGYYVIKNKEQTFRPRLGLQFKHELYQDGTSQNLPGLDIGLEHKILLGTFPLKTYVTFTPAFEDLSNYQLKHRTTFDIPLNKKNSWKLRLSLNNDYNSITSDNIKHLDTSYFVYLVFSSKD